MTIIIAAGAWFKARSWLPSRPAGAVAKFGSEPPRDDLTDPPTGYRTPSPEQPYGIGPDKKQAKVKKAGDGTEVDVPSRPRP